MLDAKKDAWARLLVERKGKRGGRQAKSLHKNAIYGMLKEKEMKVSEICMKLRIQPSAVRASLRELVKEGNVLFKKEGKARVYLSVK